MFISLDNKYIFIIAVVVIVVIFIYNIVMGNRGTYMNHSNLIWTEALKELNVQPVYYYKHKKHNTNSAGETECRRVAEQLTGFRFPKARPDFLKNEITNANLELDCFCSELGIGIEYNGKQHYEYVPHFHSSRDAFYNIKYRDQIKKRLCEENGIDLIVVPYTIRIDDIEDFIRQKLYTIFNTRRKQNASTYDVRK